MASAFPRVSLPPFWACALPSAIRISVAPDARISVFTRILGCRHSFRAPSGVRLQHNAQVACAAPAVPRHSQGVPNGTKAGCAENRSVLFRTPGTSQIRNNTGMQEPPWVAFRVFHTLRRGCDGVTAEGVYQCADPSIAPIYLFCGTSGTSGIEETKTASSPGCRAVEHVPEVRNSSEHAERASGTCRTRRRNRRPQPMALVNGPELPPAVAEGFASQAVTPVSNGRSPSPSPRRPGGEPPAPRATAPSMLLPHGAPQASRLRFGAGAFRPGIDDRH